jgi:hypothetical protein
MKTNPQSNKNHLIKVAALVAALAVPSVTLADEAAATTAQRAVNHTTPRTTAHRVVAEQASYDTVTLQPDRAVRTSAIRFNTLDGEPIR